MERRGLNRRRVALGAAAVVAVLMIAMMVMNNRIREQRAQFAAKESGTGANHAPTAPLESEGPPPRADWADPQQAQAMVDDTLPSAPDTASADGGGFVPLGADVRRSQHGQTVRGGAASANGDLNLNDDDPGDTAAGGSSAGPQGQRELTPEEIRRAAYQAAVSSRELRIKRDGATGAAPPREYAAETASAEQGNVRPYGATEVAEDEREAERAATETMRARGQGSESSAAPRPVAWQPGGRDVFRFATASVFRPCGPGERILSAGVSISALLATAVNSEVQGPILSRISRDVYDAALRCVILPAGTLLVGSPAGSMRIGADRLAVAWEAVRMPDGTTKPLPKVPTADRQGAIGLPGTVDRRTREIFQSAAVFGAISAVIAAGTPDGAATTDAVAGGYPVPSRRDRTVGAGTEPLRQAASSLIEQNVQIAPVLRVRVGAPITIIVPTDVDLDAPPTAPAGVPRDTLPIVPRRPTTES